MSAYLLDGGGAELVVVIPEHGLCHIGHGLIRMLKLCEFV